VGEWTTEMEASMGPDKPAETFRGSETVRSIGGIWVVCEGGGDMGGGDKAVNIMTLGYDPAKNKFVGTFIASMMTFLWLYEGQLDASGKALTLDAEGPSFSGDGSMSKYKDVITFVDDNYRTLTSSMPGPDGKWVTFMTAHYRRKG
jgi:hypothetical protein